MNVASYALEAVIAIPPAEKIAANAGSQEKGGKLGMTPRVYMEDHQFADITVKVTSSFVTDSNQTRIFYFFDAFDKAGAKVKSLARGNKDLTAKIGRMSKGERRSLILEEFKNESYILHEELATQATSPSELTPPVSSPPPAFTGTGDIPRSSFIGR